METDAELEKYLKASLVIDQERPRVYFLFLSIALVLHYCSPAVWAENSQRVPQTPISSLSLVSSEPGTPEKQNPIAQEEDFIKWGEEITEFLSQLQEGPHKYLQDFQDGTATFNKESQVVFHQIEGATRAFEEGKAQLGACKYKEANAKLRESAREYELVLKDLPVNSPLVPIVCYNLGHIYTHLMEWERAGETLLKAMDAQRVSVNKKDLANTYNSLGIVTLRKGDRETAILYFEECINLTKQVDYPQLNGACLGNLGVVYYLRGDPKRALQYYEAAIKIQQKLGNRHLEAKYLSNQGLIYHLHNKLSQALQAYNTALDISRKIGDRKGEASNLGNLGVIYNFQKRFEEALGAYNAALKIHRELGPRSEEAKDLGNIGIVYQSQGRLDDALSVHKESLQIHKVLGNLRGEAKDLNNIAVIYQAQGRLVEALAAYEEAYNLFLFLKSPAELEIVKQNIARIKGQIGGKE